ncbi:hypothetical protein [Umezakia ovalisporum]|jgi:hypothetical protein|uniref:Cell division protein ZapB n=2 Tax=Umezakia ovalisporum TaxID=75695 RepID=A0AA43GYH0_9CYAN|nr:hypothetical protein [Umezakia ovalisporum]MBI1241886.1 hypothetical protein [Nostoc sp. RI_552]MDH6055447.1 cell division protein ZapB [Umezakia ovalisporum FSS-43]MDH6064146.1 cell division protein ZapB [Umezakia ovalisporum FSS-62]MDH6068481.1 cell division protein ZapB [Umezakia ovalisporum APH033B]MDH6069989.1 cell division protein ZapB [Umezakia ovalisporum CobakiLakeA]
MQTTPSSVHHNPAKPPIPETYLPSVPVYVYRQLAKELQLTQAKLNALTEQKQQLEQENQLLRQEIGKVVESFLHLQKFVNSTHERNDPQGTLVTGEVKSPGQKSSPPQQVPPHRPPVVKPTRVSAPVETNHQRMPETYVVEEEVNYYPPTEKEVKEFSGWWLAIVILLIIFTAFGAGYLIVRPLLEHQNR